MWWFRGFIRLNREVDLRPVYRVEYQPTRFFRFSDREACSPYADYWLRLFDDTGRQVAQYAFYASSDFPEEVVELGPPPSARTQHFGVWAPYPKEFAHVVVERDGTELGSFSASAHAPGVWLLPPVSLATDIQPNLVRIEWRAYDLDGDWLRFTVEYGPFREDVVTNGAQLDITDPHEDFDMDIFPACLPIYFRVVVSDGLRSAFAQSGPPPRAPR